jgi:hypothetical protein
MLPKMLVNIPFKEYKIQRRKPLRVKARGMTNSNRIRADVDSSSNSTMPTAYRTCMSIFSKNYEEIRKFGRTSKNEVRYSEQLTSQHCTPERFSDNTETQGHDEQQEE